MWKQIITKFCKNLLVIIIFAWMVEESVFAASHPSEISYRKILNWIGQSKKFIVSNPDSALFYSNKASNLSKDMHDTIVALALLNKAAIFIKLGRIDEGINLEYSALSKIENYKELNFYKGQIFLNLGIAAYYKQNYDEALKFYLKAEEEFDKNKHGAYYQLLLSNLATIYINLNDYKTGKAYLEQGLNFTNEESRAKIPLIVNLIAVCAKLKQHSEVIRWAKYGEELATNYNHFEALSIIYNNLCESYLIETGKATRNGNEATTQIVQKGFLANKLDSAAYFAEKSLNIRQKNNLPLSAELLNNLGRVYFLQQKMDVSLNYFNQALEKASGFYRLQVLNNLIDWCLTNHKSGKAIGYYDEYILLDDSLKSKEFNKKIASISVFNNIERQRADNILLRQENEIQRMQIGRQRHLILILLLIGVLGIGFAYFILSRKRIKDELLKTKNKYRFLTLQLNPHFVFHVLNSIKHYLMEQKPEVSVRYLTSLSKLMRYILESSEEEKIKISEDYEVIKKYLELQQLNHNHNFNYQITVDGDLPKDLLFVPVMLTQPFVENAVVHGVSSREEGEINVSYLLKDNRVVIEITDNGRGMKIRQPHDGKMLHKSMGMEIISERITYLSKTYKKKFSLLIEQAFSCQDFPGTKIILEIPLIIA